MVITFEEAIALLKGGKQVRHEHLKPRHYIVLEDGDVWEYGGRVPVMARDYLGVYLFAKWEEVYAW